MEDMEQIYRQYMPQVYRYLFSLCRDPHLSEELTQEVFYQAIKSIDGFREECKLYVWLCQIGKRLWIKELNRKNKEKKTELTEDIPFPKSDVAAENIHQEERMLLYKSLHSLKEPVREVMYLRLCGDFSFKQIGEIMGRDENWARVTFYRGKQKVRKEIQNEM